MSTPLRDVLDKELAAIRTRRERVGIPFDPDDLVGLALSGGGIRSASFNLGVLQALETAELLPRIDYLSTVSGGGYVGSFLSASAIKCPLPTVAERQPTPNSDLVTADAAAGDDDTVETGPANATLRLSANDAGIQPADVQRLIFGGMYLRQWPALFCRYCLGLLLVNLVALSGLLFVASLIAWLVRLLDYRPMILMFDTLGFDNDMSRAFFPTLFLFVAWLLAAGVCTVLRLLCGNAPPSKKTESGLAGRRLPAFVYTLLSTLAHPLASVARLSNSRAAALLNNSRVSVLVSRRTAGVPAPAIVLIPMVLSALVAVAVLLNSGDIDLGLGPFSNLAGTDSSASPAAIEAEVQQNVNVNWWRDAIRAILIVLMNLAILPYLRPKDLIRSGTRPRSAVESWVFKIVSFVMLVGVPLMIVGIFAREDISGIEDELQKRKELTIADFVDWSQFLRQVRNHANEVPSTGQQPPVSPDSVVWRVLTGSLSNGPASGSTKNVDFVIKIEDELIQEPDAWKLVRWLGNYTQYVRVWYGEFASHPLSGWPSRKPIETPFGKRLDDVIRMNAREDVFVEWLNRDCLENLQFHEAFPKNNKDAPPGFTGTSSRWKQLQHVRGLAAGFANLHQGRLTDSERRELRGLNLQLFRIYYAKHLQAPGTVVAFNVYKDDQSSRLGWCGMTCALFIASLLLVNLNATSMHVYYRDQLSRLWLRRTATCSGDLPLTDLKTVERGAPFHLINATLNIFGKREDEDREQTERFVFSNLHCGSARTGYVATTQFAGGGYRLADAMAVSGAALTPAYNAGPLIRVMLFLTNWRLGQWVPNPKFARRRYFPAPISALIWKFWKAPQDRDWCFLSDGGHHDNTGIESLLERRCRLIIASDASGDPQYGFIDLLRVLRRSRIVSGVSLSRFHVAGGKSDTTEGGLESLVPRGENHWARSHFVVARIEYPPDENSNGLTEIGTLVYLKPTLTGDEPPELIEYHKDNKVFPHDPTLDQFYDPRRFECYRQLGSHIGEAACELLKRVMSQAVEWKTGQTLPPEGPETEEIEPAMTVAHASDKSDDHLAFASKKIRNIDELNLGNWLILSPYFCDENEEVRCSAIGKVSLLLPDASDARRDEVRERIAENLEQQPEPGHELSRKDMLLLLKQIPTQRSKSIELLAGVEANAGELPGVQKTAKIVREFLEREPPGPATQGSDILK